MEDKKLTINDMLRTESNILKRGPAYGQIVVRGAKIKCNCGDGHDVINLPLDHAVYSGTAPVVTIKDMQVDTNICNGFGVCSTPGGQKLECKKEIIVTHEWVNKQELRTRINGVEALSTDAWTICGKHGGVITIEDSGQTATYTTTSSSKPNEEKNVNTMKKNADNNFGEGTSVKTPTVSECDVAIAMLGKLWFAAAGDPKKQAELHEEANKIREYKALLGKRIPLNEALMEEDARDKTMDYNYQENIVKSVSILATAKTGSSSEINHTESNASIYEKRILYPQILSYDELRICQLKQKQEFENSLFNNEYPEGYMNWTFQEQLAYVEQQRFKDVIKISDHESAQNEALKIIRENENKIIWPEGYMDWTFQEQLAYVEQQRTQKLLDKYLDWRKVGKFLNVTFNFGFIDLGLEVVWYDGKTLKQEEIEHKYFNTYIKYKPVYSNAFVYLITGGSFEPSKSNINMLLDIKNLTKYTHTLDVNLSATLGVINAKEQTSPDQSEDDYFDDPTDYNGTFISASASFGPVVGTTATDPNQICETIGIGAKIGSFVPSLGTGMSKYILIPQKDTIELVDYIMQHKNVKTHKNGGQPDKRRIHERSRQNGDIK